MGNTCSLPGSKWLSSMKEQLCGQTRRSCSSPGHHEPESERMSFQFQGWACQGMPCNPRNEKGDTLPFPGILQMGNNEPKTTSVTPLWDVYSKTWIILIPTPWRSKWSSAPMRGPTINQEMGKPGHLREVSTIIPSCREISSADKRRNGQRSLMYRSSWAQETGRTCVRKGRIDSSLCYNEL